LKKYTFHVAKLDLRHVYFIELFVFIQFHVRRAGTQLSAMPISTVAHAFTAQ
jgi:hypothetical protein